jgi:hypothetical protein
MCYFHQKTSVGQRLTEVSPDEKSIFHQFLANFRRPLTIRSFYVSCSACESVYCDVMRPVDQLCVVGNVHCVAFALQEIDRRLLFHPRAIVA